MPALSDDAAAAVVRGIGAYVRATPAPELPSKLKRFKRFDRPQALVAHQSALLAVLDTDEPTRARIAEWVKDGRPPLAKPDLEILALVTERPDGWLDQVATLARPPKSRPSPKKPTAPASVDARRAEERAARARDELRRARAELQAELREERARALDLEKSLAAAEARAADLEARAADLEKSLDAATRAAERAERKTRAASERAAAREKKLKDELREARAGLKAAAAGADAPRRSKGSPRTRPRPSPIGPRAPLPVPKGRLETDPETLAEWLEVAGVLLLVDGYNVTKAEGGYGDTPLEQQRRRLTEDVGRLARRKAAAATIVFDGSEVAPGTSRRPRGPARVEYSKPGETADDHLVATLRELPPTPVVVVTNDRELQSRAAALGATIATSDQLLALIR